MNYDGNYGGYCSTCGSTNGCSCGCGGGYDYSTCSPDYNPITVNNSPSPCFDSNSAGGAGGTASGNNSSVCVNVGGCNCGHEGKKDDCCCKNGIKKLLDYLYLKALDLTIKTNSICLYGDIIPPTAITCDDCALLSIQGNSNIQITSITDDIIKLPCASGVTSPLCGTVSLCAISVVQFTFEGLTSGMVCDENTDLRREFFYTPKCGCSCDCGNGIAQAIYLNGLGNDYTLKLQDTLSKDITASVLSQGKLEDVTLVAVDSCIAIFSKTISGECVYYGVPTCRIAQFVQI